MSNRPGGTHAPGGAYNKMRPPKGGLGVGCGPKGGAKRQQNRLPVLSEQPVWASFGTLFLFAFLCLKGIHNERKRDRRPRAKKREAFSEQ